MPAKRKLDDVDQTATPSTPKKPRRTTNGTPRSVTKNSKKLTTADADVYDFDTAIGSTVASEVEDDELVQSPVQKRVPKNTSTPRKRPSPSKDPPRTRTPKKVKSINDTPTKSTARRVNGRSRQLVNEDEDDPAANLILQVADQELDEDEDAQSNEDDDDGSEVGKDNGHGVALHGGFEAYFDQASRKQQTSNNTLSKMPLLPHSEYLKIIKDYKLPYQDAIQSLYDSHVRAFPEWSFELDQEYSLCLTGYGSKKTLIEEFCAREAQEHGDAFIIINGYHPTIDLRQICSSITTGLDKTGADVDAALEALDGMEYERLILAIHNIDGANLRTEKVQSQLARLVGHSSVRMICSIDHIHAPLLFSASRANELHLLYHDATTFMPYTLETELLPDILSTATKTALVGDRGIKWILQTVSQNARKIFRILLLDQIETGQGMESARLFERASAAFAVSSKTAFNAHLVEFFDHKIVLSERGGENNAEVLSIPFEKVELQRVLEDIDAGDASDDGT